MLIVEYENRDMRIEDFVRILGIDAEGANYDCSDFSLAKGMRLLHLPQQHERRKVKYSDIDSFSVCAAITRGGSFERTQRRERSTD